MSTSTESPQVHVRCTDREKELYRDAALAAGFVRPSGEPNISVWIKNTLHKEAQRVLRQQKRQESDQ